MNAVVIAKFFAAPDGEVYPRHFMVGDAVTGALARVAVAEGWAEPGEAAVDPEAPIDPEAPKTVTTAIVPGR